MHDANNLFRAGAGGAMAIYAVGVPGEGGGVMAATRLEAGFMGVTGFGAVGVVPGGMAGAGGGVVVTVMLRLGMANLANTVKIGGIDITALGGLLEEFDVSVVNGIAVGNSDTALNQLTVEEAEGGGVVGAVAIGVNGERDGRGINNAFNGDLGGSCGDD